MNDETDFQEDGSVVIGFRVKPGIKERAKRKAEEKGLGLSEVMRDYVKAFVGTNSELEELEREKREAEKEFEEAKAKLESIKQQMEAEKEKIPKKYVDYYMKKSGEWSDERTEEYLKESAENLGMPLEDFKKGILRRLKERGVEVEGK